jgi:DNA-binding NtrC family response regulator
MAKFDLKSSEKMGASQQQILFAWIGNSDRKACGAAVGHKGDGPIAETLVAGEFRGVVLLDDKPEECPSYRDWLEQKTGLRPKLVVADLPNGPTDYGAIYRAARKVLADHETGSERHGADWSLLLSAGTPAMASVWLMLGRALFPKARLLETSSGKGLQEVDFPFDLLAEFKLDLPRRPANEDVLLAKAFEAIIHRDPVMHEQLLYAQRYGRRQRNVLILGKSGTGKEEVAKAIHIASGRRGKLVTVNCGAIPQDLVESELFGHSAGAFTGASSTGRSGKILESNDGTLFLDEIGELPLDIQVKFLRVLQEREVTPVGSDKPSGKLDFLVVAATHCDLAKAVVEGQFREDLYYRIARGILILPPLGDRGKDIALLANHFLRGISEAIEQLGLPSKRFSPDAMRRLQSHTWPGNVRELYYTVERAADRHDQAQITGEDVHASILRFPAKVSDLMSRSFADDFSLKSLHDELEEHYCRLALDQEQGNVAAAARLLGCSRPALAKKLKRLGIQDDG